MASTLLNEQGWNRDATLRQLAHTERNSIRAAYNYAEHLPERRRMMQAWACTAQRHIWRRGPSDQRRELSRAMVFLIEQDRFAEFAGSPDEIVCCVLARCRTARHVRRRLSIRPARYVSTSFLSSSPLVIAPSATVPAEWETVDGVMLDVLMKSHDRYGVNGSACYLLRPDTVVAARARLAEWDKVNQHLSSIFK